MIHEIEGLTLPKREPPEVRRKQILSAASECIASHGFERATMDDIAGAAGLSKGSLYWHFDSKGAVLDALLEEVTQTLADAWRPESVLEPQASVVAQGLDALKAFASNRTLLETWLELLHHADARDGMSALYAQIRQMVAKALGQRTHKTSAGLIALMEGLLVQATVDPKFDPAPVWRLNAPKLLATP